MPYYELTPAYGHDYKSAAEVKAAWRDGKDWNGDWQLNFMYVNRESLEANKPYTVILRYAKNTKLVTVKETR